MATTTNYSWTTPDDTALVKDGAAAIRSLGTAIDTTTKNLNPSTTAGDIEYRSSTTNVNTRLALGTAGQLLQVNSGATAPEWATVSTGGMTLISTTTISNAEVLLSSIPSTYNNLYIVIRDFLPTNDTSNLRIRFNDDSNANRHADGVTLNSSLTFDQTASNVLTNLDDTASDTLITITIPDYTNTVTRKIYTSFSLRLESNGTTWHAQSLFGAFSQTSAISSLRFLTSASVPKSGTILLYGVK